MDLVKPLTIEHANELFSVILPDLANPSAASAFIELLAGLSASISDPQIYGVAWSLMRRAYAHTPDFDSRFEQYVSSCSGRGAEVGASEQSEGGSPEGNSSADLQGGNAGRFSSGDAGSSSQFSVDH